MEELLLGGVEAGDDHDERWRARGRRAAGAGWRPGSRRRAPPRSARRSGRGARGRGAGWRRRARWRRGDDRRRAPTRTCRSAGTGWRAGTPRPAVRPRPASSASSRQLEVFVGDLGPRVEPVGPALESARRAHEVVVVDAHRRESRRPVVDRTLYARVGHQLAAVVATPRRPGTASRSRGARGSRGRCRSGEPCRSRARARGCSASARRARSARPAGSCGPAGSSAGSCERPSGASADRARSTARRARSARGRASGSGPARPGAAARRTGSRPCRGALAHEREHLLDLLAAAHGRAPDPGR